FREKERKYDKIICSYKSPKISCPTKGLSFIKVVNWCYMNTLFKTFKGISIQQYCRNCKLSYAVRLLKEEKSIADIIAQLGYQNKSYFYRIFKEKYGMTPNEYRKNMK
ncbi:AraC family transcriptional regulator, partial [Petralouisia muris]